MTDIKTDSKKWQDFIDIIQELRGENGCPWDKAQNHQSLKPYLIEEAYEVLEAIDMNRADKIADELGDVLLQVVLHSQLAAEENLFDINDVVDNISQKMLRRHPHVFADAQAADAKEVLASWELIKAEENKTAADHDKSQNSIMKINSNMPSLMMAQKVQAKAARVGFDWPNIDGAWEKVAEEIEELKNAPNQEAKMDELGDCIFALVNLARFWNFDAEDALRHTVGKFIRRFQYIEKQLEEAKLSFDEVSLEDMDKIWEEAKKEERKL
ncbi:MAG: nucleoside triphosphate pyrophosphohydrolase [Clostridiales bacterium]